MMFSLPARESYNPHRNQWLVPRDKSGKIWRWDLANGTGLSLIEHNRDIIDVAISNDNRWLVTKDGSRRVCGLILLEKDLVQKAQRMTAWNLRQDEWDQYFPGEEYRKTFPDIPDGCRQLLESERVKYEHTPVT